MRVLIIGAGYCGWRIGQSLLPDAEWVTGTRRSTAACRALQTMGLDCLMLTHSPSPEVLARVADCTHLLSTAAPGAEGGDPVLEWLEPMVARMPALRWLGYLSTIGVYGNYDGEWVTEASLCRSQQARSRARIAAETRWQSLASRRKIPLAILRLSGIYGPGRNALRNIERGRSRIILKRGQIFNRIHVDDIVQATGCALRGEVQGIFNISDNEPSPPEDVVRYAHRLMEIKAPAGIPFEQADLTPMARSFYGENKRVCNRLSRDALGVNYRYPDYQSGLDALWSSGDWRDPGLVID